MRAAVVLVVVGVVAVVGYSGSCVSTTIPRALSPSERAFVETTRFAARVGVERFHFPAYSDGLTKALRATRLFTNVEDLRAFQTAPDLIARIERTIYGTATVPFLTAISLGFVPTTVSEEHGYAFSLAGGLGVGADRVPIEFRYSGPTTLGWYAVFLNLSPNRTRGDARDHPRFRDGLAWTLVQKRDAIQALLRKRSEAAASLSRGGGESRSLPVERTGRLRIRCGQ